MHIYFIFLLFNYFYITEAKIISTFKLRKIETDADIKTDEYLVSIDNRYHHLILTEFESNNYETSVWVNGKSYNRIKHKKGTFVKGRLANDANSKLFLHINEGINGLILIGNNTFEVKPMKNENKMKKNRKNAKSMLLNDHDHIAIVSSQKENHLLRCGNNDEESIFSNDIKMKYFDTHFSVNPNVRNVTKILSLSMVIPLEVVNDKRWGLGDINKTIDTALLHAHTLNYFFTPFNMAVLVGHIEIHTDHKIIPILASPLTMGNILNLGVARRKEFHDNGKLDFSVTLIFTNYTNWPAVGLSYAGVICASNSRLATSAIYLENLETTASIMAHEIGHNFGLGHTNKINPNCTCEKICIMNAYISNANIDKYSWNTCDYKIMNDSWSKFCVEPPPNFKPLDQKYCGNNILELGEDCDCGLPSDCAAKKLDKCCDALACRFYNNTECVDGPCCKDCKFLPINSSCKIYSNECYNGICTGKPIQCNMTDIKPNGTLCNNNMDMCYKGKCIEHGSRCKNIFGQLAVLANEACHAYFNKRTSASGNCGYNDKEEKFIKCGNNDYLCGKLICKGKFESHNDSSYTYEVNEDGCEVKYLTKLDKYFENILMVNEGISCGANNICFDNKCLSDDEVFAYKASKICGAYSTITINDECMCSSGFDKINSTCFLKTSSIKSIYSIIIILSIIQTFVILCSITFMVKIFFSKRPITIYFKRQKIEIK